MLLMGKSPIKLFNYGYFQVCKLLNYQRSILGKSMFFFHQQSESGGFDLLWWRSSHSYVERLNTLRAR